MEITAVTLQTVEANQNIQFSDVAVRGSCSIIHREGSGLVTLRGLTDQCRARYRVTFGANVALPDGAAVAPITVAISINGEAIGSATMITTPAATESFDNISASVFINVPSGCCYTISVKNLSTGAIEVTNANLIAERVA